MSCPAWRKKLNEFSNASPLGSAIGKGLCYMMDLEAMVQELREALDDADDGPTTLTRRATKLLERGGVPDDDDDGIGGVGSDRADG